MRLGGSAVRKGRGLLGARGLFGALSLLPASLWTTLVWGASPAVLSAVEAGRRLYVDGVLANGLPLEGRLPGGVLLQARSAACVNCHRPSGLGGAEGSTWVPPVAGPELFGDRVQTDSPARLAPGLARTATVRDRAVPYTAPGLDLALREGRTPQGLTLAAPMPRYALSAQDLQALEAYLRQLSAAPSPGAGPGTLHFATVIAPGVDALSRQGMVDVLQACFRERHPAGRAGVPAWMLHVWDLVGEPALWDEQLRRRLANEPVFALIGGLGAVDWSPVHAFCEREAVPCLFPQVPLPGAVEPGRYSFYFSSGVLLEAQLLAKAVLSLPAAAVPRRVVQLHAVPVGAAGAGALQQAMADAGGPVVQSRRWTGAADDATGLNEALADVGSDDALVLWLPPEAWVSLARHRPAPPSGLNRLLASGQMADLDRAGPASAWQRAAVFSYLLDPPGRRELRMQRNLRPWLAGKPVAPADERVLGNALTACNLLTESVARLQGRLVRDRLVEVLEAYPSAMGNAPAPQAYPRFELGPGQRFSARGGYLVRLTDESPPRLEPVMEWTVP
jgi:Cytochrome c